MDTLQILIGAIAGVITAIGGLMVMNNRNGKIIADRFEKLTVEKDAHDKEEKDVLTKERDYLKTRTKELDEQLAATVPILTEFPVLKKQVEILQAEVTQLRCDIEKALTENDTLRTKLSTSETENLDLKTKVRVLEQKVENYETALKLLGKELQGNSNGKSDHTNANPAG